MLSFFFFLKSWISNQSITQSTSALDNSSQTNSIEVQTDLMNQTKCQELQVKELLDSIENKSSNKKLQNQTKFDYGEKILFMEDMQIEYKNYLQFPFNKDQQDSLRQTICAFLNSLGGRIYIGIADKTNSVNGLKLTQKQRDDLRLQIDQLVDNSFLIPLVKPQEVKTVFLPVYNKISNCVIPGKYVIKIIVRKGQANKLYFLTNHSLNSCYTRRDGKNQFLKPNEFTDLILERQHLELTAEQQNFINQAFKDPEPDQISEIFDDEENKKNNSNAVIPNKKPSLYNNELLIKFNSQNAVKQDSKNNYFEIYFSYLKNNNKFHPTQIISQFCNKKQYEFRFIELEDNSQLFNIILEVQLSPTMTQSFKASGSSKKQQKIETSVQAIHYFSSNLEFQQFFKAFLEKNHWQRYVNNNESFSKNKTSIINSSHKK